MLVFHVNAHNSSKFTIELLNNLANQYQEVQIVSPDYAVVGKGGKFGAVDYNGKLILPIIYTKIEKFYDGMAVIQDGKYKYGYIDENFKLVIPCIYSDATEFCNGLAVVEINKSTSERNDFISEFDNDKGVCKFIDKKGQIDEASSNLLSSFPQNNITNRYGTYGEYGVFYCDEKIYFVESPGNVKSFHYEYDWAPRLGKGYAIIHHDGKEGVVTYKGLIIPLKYNSIQEVGGNFMVEINSYVGGSQCGLFDYDGKQIYPCRYSFVGYGFTVTHNGDEWKILDTNTNETLVINDNKIKDVVPLNNNVISLSYLNESETNIKIIDKKGKLLASGMRTFEKYNSCVVVNGLASTCIVDNKGQLLFGYGQDEKWKYVEPICDNFYMTREWLGDNKLRYGLLNAMGQEVLPCEYDEIRSEYGLFHLKKNGKITYFECIDVIDLLNKLNNNLNLGEQAVEREDYKEGLAYYKKANEILDILEKNLHLLNPAIPNTFKKTREYLNNAIESKSELIK